MTDNLRLTILHTSDTHGSVLSHQYSNNQEVQYGLSKISSLIKIHRTENTILIDTGDTIQGSPLLYTHQINRNKFKNPVATVMNYLEYDYFIPGNHDFNYGIDYLKGFTSQLKAKKLCSNILNNDESYFFDSPYEVIELKKGLKVAIIGLTTNYIPHWEQASTIKDLLFNNAFETTKSIVEEIKNQHNISLFILGYHGGFEKSLDSFELNVKDTGENLGAKILEEIPEIDIILSGHQHQTISRKVKGKIVMQPASNAQYLSKVEIDFMKNTDWSIAKIDCELLSTKGISSDENIYNLIKDVEDHTQEFLDQVIGTVPNNDLEVTDEFQARLHKHKIVSFINDVQIDATNAMISCTALSNAVTGFNKEITVRNVLSTYVYPNTLTLLEIDGKNLKLALEKNAEYFTIEDDEIAVNPKYHTPKIEHYNYDMFDGIDYTIDLKKSIGNRISNVIYNGKVIKETDMFSLVMNNYRASGGGDFDMFQDLKVLKEIPIDIAELLIDYIRKHKKISIREINNIKIIK